MKIAPAQIFRASYVNSSKGLDRQETALASCVDSFSFKGEVGTPIKFVKNFNCRAFPADLYLNREELFNKLYAKGNNEIFNYLPHAFGELLAQRANYAKITVDARLSSLSTQYNQKNYYDPSMFIGIKEKDDWGGGEALKFDWSEECSRLKEILDWAEDDKEAMEEGLDIVLREQGWMK